MLPFSEFCCYVLGFVMGWGAGICVGAGAVEYHHRYDKHFKNNKDERNISSTDPRDKLREIANDDVDDYCMMMTGDSKCE